MTTPEYTYTPEGGMTQTFSTKEKRDAYAAWHQSLGEMVERERQRMQNEQDRAQPSARVQSRIIGDQMRDENAMVNAKLSGTVSECGAGIYDGKISSYIEKKRDLDCHPWYVNGTD